jgi:hypothetical protein
MHTAQIHLMRNYPAGTYFARVGSKGKLIRNPDPRDS